MVRRSKVSPPFGITVTLAFIDPVLMEDLCYYISVWGCASTSSSLSSHSDMTDQLKNRFMFLDVKCKCVCVKCVVIFFMFFFLLKKGPKCHTCTAHYLALVYLNCDCPYYDDTSKYFTFGSRSSQQFSISAT